MYLFTTSSNKDDGSIAQMEDYLDRAWEKLNMPQKEHFTELAAPSPLKSLPSRFSRSDTAINLADVSAPQSLFEATGDEDEYDIQEIVIPVLMASADDDQPGTEKFEGYCYILLLLF